MDRIAVVGGGMAGLVSSLLLAQQGYQVTLVEKEDWVGGLLRTFQNEAGVSFDLGTHIPSQTMIQELDEILFGDLDKEKWNEFKILKAGNYFGGKLYKQSQMIYTPHLPDEIYCKGVIDLLQTVPFHTPVNNLKTYTEMKFGQTFSQHIFGPLMKKLQGCELDQLHPNAHLIFGYNRLIIGNEYTSRELKKSSFYDEKISYVSYNEGISPATKYYPSNGKGIGEWINHLEEKIRKLGVTLKKGKSVSRIVNKGAKIQSVILDSSETIECDHLIWTLAPYLLLKAAFVKVDSKPPSFQKMGLYHFVFDKPFLVDNHYIYCNDPELNSFRVTLYPNISGSIHKGAPYNCTVEVISNKNKTEISYESIVRELMTMGIVDINANVIYQYMHEITNGFPVYSNEYVETMKQHREIVNQIFDNVSLFGRGAGEAFFMNDVLVQVYKGIISRNLSRVEVGSTR